MATGTRYAMANERLWTQKNEPLEVVEPTLEVQRQVLDNFANSTIEGTQLYSNWATLLGWQDLDGVQVDVAAGVRGEFKV